MNNLEYRARRREIHNKSDNKLRQEILLYLGNKCVGCGIDDFRVLQIDHINNNGCEERKQFRGWSVNRYYHHILEVKGQGYQLLCANCNWIKRYEQLRQKTMQCRVCGISLENNIYKGQHGICKQCQNQRRSDYNACHSIKQSN